MQWFVPVALLCSASLALATCTKTETAFVTTTAETSTTSSEYPTTTVTIYSSTVLVATPYSGPHPFPYPHPANPHTCSYYTETETSPPPSGATLEISNADASSCQTTTETVTVEKQCTFTQIIYPPPVKTHHQGVLTTSVPNFCASPAQRSTGEIPDGDQVFSLGYPYFAQTTVECCVYCSEQYYNLVAAAYIRSGEDCQCLVNKGNTYPGKSRVCPRGIQPYTFRDKPGSILPGPCRVAP